MARGAYSAGNRFITSSPAITAPPISMACWFYQSSATIGVLTLHGSDGSQIHRLLVTDTGQVQAASFKTLPSASGSSLTGTSSLNTWHSAVGVWASSSSRTAYLNGVAAATNTTNVNVPTLTEASVGARFSGGTEHDGYIAALGIWNVALTSDEANALGKGFSPHLIRPGNLVHHMPLIRSSTDLQGNMLEFGTVPVARHAPIIGAIAA